MYGNSSLRNLDFLLRTMGQNVSGGGGSILEAAEDDRNGGSFWKTLEDGSSTYYNHVFGRQVEVMHINVPQTLQHPLASGSRPLPQTQHRSLDDEDDTRFTAGHPTAGAVLPATPDGDGDIEMGDTTENNLNTFSPFSSELDWRIAEWAIKEKVGNSAIDRLLEIPGVCVPLALTSL